MKLLRGLRFASGESLEAPVASPVPAGLPHVNAFVEIAVNGSRQRESVPVNEIRAGVLFTRGLAGLRAGDTADFLYTNDSGRFRFATVCTQADRIEAAFALPAAIRTIESFANRRVAARVPLRAPAHWRLAPEGRGVGPFLPAALVDVSSSGAAMVVEGTLERGAQVELRFALGPADRELYALSHVVRTTHLERSNKHAAGLRFLTIDPDMRKRLGDFVVEAQMARRDRGVA